MKIEGTPDEIMEFIGLAAQRVIVETDEVSQEKVAELIADAFNREGFPSHAEHPGDEGGTHAD